MMESITMSATFLFARSVKSIFTDLTLILVVVTSLLFDCLVFSFFFFFKFYFLYYFCVGPLMDFTLRWCEVYKWVCLFLLLLQYGVWTFWYLRCRSSSIPFHLLWSWMSKSFISLRLQSFIRILGRDCSLEMWGFVMFFFSLCVCVVLFSVFWIFV